MLLGGMVMTGSLSGENITHESEELTTLEKMQNLKRKVIFRGNLPHVSMVKQHKIIDQLSRFELGCFLIDTGGLNGFWTHYLLMHPIRRWLTDVPIGFAIVVEELSAYFNGLNG